jgi:membrane protease YdiL (CAAX protease family)
MHVLQESKYMDENIEGVGTFQRSISFYAFLAGLLVIAGAAYSQYVISFGTIEGFLVVYGIPLVVISVPWGRSIIQKALHHFGIALKYGLGFFGVFTIIGVVAGIIIFYILATIDPSTLNLLNRPNPVLQVSEEYAWIMVGVSLVVVGPAEEYLFRGFVYGGMLSLFHRHHWLSLAFISSLFFAGMHLYYASVYGLASLITFADLITFGMAMAATYYFSGGNLIAPALIHGLYDAIGFLGVATSTTILVVLRGSMLFIALLVGLLFFLQMNQKPTYLESAHSIHPSDEGDKGAVEKELSAEKY